MEPQRLLLLALVFVLTQGQIGGFESLKFLTDVLYKDALLDIKPFVTREIGSLVECQGLCAGRSSCRAFAFGGRCVSQCRLYDSNLCKNTNIKIKSQQKSHTVWDKVDFKANFSCQTDITFKNCLKSQFGRCGGCKREGFHGPSCQFIGRGCPKRYEFHNGSCSWMSGSKADMSSVNASCASNAGGRFGLVRNGYSNSMLWAWSRSLGLNGGVFVGVEKSGAFWKRNDGRLLRNEGQPPSDDAVYDNWWNTTQPSESVQSAVIMDKTKNFSYNDDMDYVARNFFCEVAAENCTAFPMQITDDSDGTCYNLHQQSANFSAAADVCVTANGTLAKVRDLKTHEMLAGFLRLKKVDADVYVGIVSSQGEKYQGRYHDGTAVTFALPWDKTQPNFLIETVVVLTTLNGTWDDVLRKVPNGYFCEYIAKSCYEWHRFELLEDGLYRLLPNASQVDFDVRCDMTSAGGGWTVIQRRRGDASVSFNRTMKDYKAGFGHLDGDFWLGLEKIRLLTSQEAVHLMVKMVDANNVSRSVVYSDFRLLLESTTDAYSFTVGRVLSNATGEMEAADGLSPSNSAVFSTHDSDNEQKCASASGGGWWFPLTNCSTTKPNGFYPGRGPDVQMQWSGMLLTRVQMMIKPSIYFKD